MPIQRAVERACDSCAEPAIWHHAECAGLKATCEEELPENFVCKRCGGELNEAEALAAAEDEGLELVRSWSKANSSGFEGVRKNTGVKPSKERPWAASFEGKSLGTFSAAAAAALAIARRKEEAAVPRPDEALAGGGRGAAARALVE